MKRTMKTDRTVELVEDVLAHYAKRGVFRSFGRIGDVKGKPTFRMRWHYDRTFDLVFDPKTQTLRFTELLPEVTPKSAMHRALKTYIASRQAETVPEHRRIDPGRIQMRAINRGGSVSLSAKALDGDVENAARKLVHLAHEIYLDFLSDGRYYDYLVGALGFNEDAL
jgi:hypothetical protein